MRNERGDAKIGFIVLVVAVCILIAVACAAGCPHYNVWNQEMEGRAKFAEAEQSRRILVEEARAKKDAATALAEAEIARAKGVAEANAIIGKSLAGNEAYLRYLWIQGLNDGTGEVIYVPTEAGLPILEAGHRK